MTPSQPGPPCILGLLRHLKSGARGLRLDSRSSHIFPPQMGQAGSSAVPAGAGGGASGSRGGQMTPSHPLSRHLKSGARGLRLDSRLSHISPPHLGQAGVASSGDVLSGDVLSGC